MFRIEDVLSKNVFLQTGAFEGGTILTSPFFTNALLPFILIFTVIFAILQKAKVLGDGKKQIDAIVSLVIALIVITFANAVGIINSLLPFLAVSVVIILILMILLGVMSNGDFDSTYPKALRWVVGGIFMIALVIAVLIATGAWDYLWLNLFYTDGGTTIVTNVVFFIIVIAAIVAVLWQPKKKKD